MTTNSAEREFVFEDWLSEGIKGLREKHRRMHKRLVPEEFCTHLKAAKKETLLAFRSLVDEAIERTEPETHKKATKIKVE